MSGTDGVTRVWIDDRHPVFLRGVRSILQSEDFEIVGESAAFRPEPEPQRFDILFFEADAWGLQHAVQLLQDHDVRLVALVDEAEERLIADLAEAGAAAIVFRHDLSPAKLVTALHAVAAGNSALPADLLPKMLERAARGAHGGVGQLSDRELSVLKLLSEGEDTNDIAERLSYSSRTVKNIVHDALMKMNCRNRAHAVAQATRQGLI
ncbi:MAG: response regulator transcription factor [Actinomycetota bacterium]